MHPGHTKYSLSASQAQVTVFRNVTLFPKRPTHFILVGFIISQLINVAIRNIVIQDLEIQNLVIKFFGF